MTDNSLLGFWKNAEALVYSWTATSLIHKKGRRRRYKHFTAACPVIAQRRWHCLEYTAMRSNIFKYIYCHYVRWLNKNKTTGPERGFDLVALWTISRRGFFYDVRWEEKLIKTVAKNNLKLITQADAEQETKELLGINELIVSFGEPIQSFRMLLVR